jgi:GTPase SAR1 family protein
LQAHRHLANPAQARTLAAIDELLSEAGDALGSPVLEHVREGARRVAQARLNLVVLGEFKRGKSTLINSLLEVELLPTGVVPLTSAITILRHGSRPRLIVRYQDGHAEEHDASDLRRFVTERENPGNQLAVDSTIVETPAALLSGGVQLVDTPGIGSVHEHNTRAAWEFLSRIDAAICVLNADQPFTHSEREFFLAAAARVPRLLVVVNKVDHLSRDERLLAIEFIEDVSVQLSTSSELEFYAVSARDGEGIPRLRERIRQLAADEAGALVAHSVAKLATGAAAAAAQTARFESRAIELPLEDLRRRATLFAESVADLQNARAEAADLLRVGVARVLDERVNQPLSEFARERADELSADLSAHAALLGRLPPRTLAPALDAWIDDTTRQRFGELVPRVGDAVRDYQRELSGSVDEAVAAIQRTVERASRQLTAGQQAIAKRRAELETRADRLEAIGEELSTLWRTAALPRDPRAAG